MREPKAFCVYIMSNCVRGVLYTGVTSDLIARVSQHRGGLLPGFTREHGLKTLVWFESHMDTNEAIAREKRIKRWRRAWKFRLIEAVNPEWCDLRPGLLAGELPDALAAVPDKPLRGFPG